MTFVLPVFIAFQSVFSGLFLRVGHALIRTYLDLTYKAKTTWGKVTGYEEIRFEEGGVGYKAIIRFTPQGGVEREAKAASSTGLKPKVGDVINIAYFPGDLETVEPIKHKRSWLFFGCAAIMIVPGAYLYFIISRMPLEIILVSLASHTIGYWIAKKYVMRAPTYGR